MITRITFKKTTKGYLESKTIVSDRSKGRYKVRLYSETAPMKWDIRNLLNREVVKKGESNGNHIRYVKDMIKIALRQLGVKFKVDLRRNKPETLKRMSKMKEESLKKETEK